MDVLKHFKDGEIDAAIDAATADVKAKPDSALARVMLSEMLCFAGDWERADTILDAALLMDPSAAVAISAFRHLLLAEASRRDFYAHGAMPAFLSEPDDQAKLRLKAALHLREDDPAAAAELLEQAEAQRPAVAGRHGDTAFTDFVDGDDLLGPYLEVLSPDGRYFWIPGWAITSLTFAEPKRPLDLLFREAKIVTDDASGQVFIPTLYAGVATEDPQLRLCRATDWSDTGGVVRGLGQRIFFADETELSVMELEVLDFSGAGAGEAAGAQAEGGGSSDGGAA